MILHDILITNIILHVKNCVYLTYFGLTLFYLTKMLFYLAYFSQKLYLLVMFSQKNILRVKNILGKFFEPSLHNYNYLNEISSLVG